MLAYAYRVGTALSCLLNALCGGDPSESTSLVIGRNIIAGGFFAHFPLPGWFRDHCLRAFGRAQP